MNENYSSQIPSCWSTGHGGNPRPGFNPPPHPDIPDTVPLEAQRLQEVNGIWSVKQCPHCHTIWNRDVNACRYDDPISNSNDFNLLFRNIGVIYESLRDHNRRPAIFGAPKEGEVIDPLHH